MHGEIVGETLLVLEGAAHLRVEPDCGADVEPDSKPVVERLAHAFVQVPASALLRGSGEVVTWRPAPTSPSWKRFSCTKAGTQSVRLLQGSSWVLRGDEP